MDMAKGIWHVCLWRTFQQYKFKKKTNFQLITCAHVGVSVLFLLFHFNLPVLTFILAKNFSFILLMHFKRKLVIWICATFWLFLIILFKYWEQHDQIGTILNLDDFQCYELVIILSWNILKSISFSIDYISNEDMQTTNTFDLMNIYGYVLYFPNLLLGPFMMFSRYNGITQSANLWSGKNAATNRYVTLMVDLSRACFWFLFTDFALHFIYLGNLQQNTDVSCPIVTHESNQR